MWQNWWMRESLVSGQDISHSELLFYPNGLDLTLQPRRWTTFPLWLFLYEQFGDPFAFNLTALIGIFVEAYAMYLLVLSLTRHRFAAWVGGAFFAFAARSLSLALQQPNTGAIEFIPIFMLLWIYLLNYTKRDDFNTQKGWLLTIVVTLAYSANIYTNLKIGIFATLIGGLYFLWFLMTEAGWRNKRIWQIPIIFGMLSFVTALPILSATFSSGYLNIAIEDTNISGGVDLLAYVKADVSKPLFYNNYFAQFSGVSLTEFSRVGLSHIGFLSIIATFLGLITILKQHRKHLIWGIMAFIFFGFSLGLEITINLKSVDIVAPYSLVADNIIFQALRKPHRFAMLMLFPMSILVAFGIRWIADILSTRLVVQWVGGVTLVSLMLFETSIFPITYRSAKVADMFTSEIFTKNPGAIITIPMGRQEVKYHMYTQMWHRQPIHEGMIGRLPPNSYNYIKGNPVLRDWRDLDELTMTLDEWYEGIDNLIEDGFRYVVVHKYVITGRDMFTTNTQRETFFSQAPALWEDIESRLYDLNTLRDYPPPSLLSGLSLSLEDKDAIRGHWLTYKSWFHKSKPNANKPGK